MRNLGLLFIVLGVVGFAWSSSQLSKLDPVPQGTSIERSLDYPAGRWEVARYAAAGMAGVGVLLAMFPRGR